MLENSGVRKMKVQYKSDLYASYIQIPIPEGVDRKQYAFQMLQKNSIQGVLEAKERMEEGEPWLYLDITGKVSLHQQFKDREMELEEMTEIFQQLITVFEELRNYLLTDKFVLADPEFIYRDIETGKLFTAVLPWEREEEQGLRRLAEFFLEKMDAKDENGINTAYLFYKQQGNPNFSLYQFLPAMEKENILKRQKKQELHKELGGALPVLADFPEEKSLWEEELKEKPKKKGRRKAKRGKKLFFGFFRRKKEVDPRFDLRMDEEMMAAETYTQPDYGETVFFEDKLEEWVLQWWEKGKSKTAPLDGLPITVGKLKEEATIIIEDSSVSRIHCRFIEHNGGIAIVDMDSTNGTSLNGMKLKSGEIMAIAKNDEILIGKVRALVV